MKTFENTVLSAVELIVFPQPTVEHNFALGTQFDGRAIGWTHSFNLAGFESLSSFIVIFYSLIINPSLLFLIINCFFYSRNCI